MASKRSSAGAIGLANTPDRWQVESDLDTLVRAKEICKDKKRYAKVVALAKEKMLSMGAVAGDAQAT